MKKILIAIIALAVLAAGSVTAFLIVKNKSDKEQQSKIEAAAENNIFSFDADSIVSVYLNCSDGEYTAQLTDSKWILTNEEDSFDLDQDYFGNMCQYLSSLTAETNYGDATNENKAMYGLDDPDVITLSDGSNEYTVYVGSQSPTSEYYYIMAEGKSKVYAIDALNGSVLIASRMMMKDKSLIPYGDSEVHGIELIRNGKTIYNLTYDTENSAWTLPEEYSALTMDQTKVTSMVNVMTRIEAQTMMDEHLEDYSEYGFDKPYAELIVTGSDGSQRKLLFSYYGDDVKTYTHVLFEETGQVAAFYTGDVDFIENSPKNFIAEQAYTVTESQISGFRLTLGDEISIDAEMNQSESKFILNGVSLAEVDADAVTDFHSFFSSFAKMTVADVDVEESPEYTQPYMSLHYTFTDGTEALIELISAGDKGYYMFFDGEYNGIIIGEDSLTGKYSISYFYEELTENVDLG